MPSAALELEAVYNSRVLPQPQQVALFIFGTPNGTCPPGTARSQTSGSSGGSNSSSSSGSSSATTTSSGAQSLLPYPVLADSHAPMLLPAAPP